jgi:hypothetical protein
MRSPISLRRVAVLRRLLLRSLLGAALVAGAVALFTGCRENAAVVRTDGVRLADLRAMVLPQQELGLLGVGMQVDGDTGWTRNRKSARESLDPDDSARSLRRAGRLGGYLSVYERQPGTVAELDEHPLAVQTEVELFRDEANASAYLRRQLALAFELRGKPVAGGRLAAVSRLPAVSAGDESGGLRLTVKYDRGVAYFTLIGFRRDRLVASAATAHAVEAGGPGDLRHVAATLEDRIERVAAGEFRTVAVSRPR